MKVLFIRPGEEPELGELYGSAKIRAYIGGCFETVEYKGFLIVCNDSFLLNDTRYNCTIGGTQFFGNIFVCKVGMVNGEYDLVGLDQSDIDSPDFIDFFMHCRRVVYF